MGISHVELTDDGVTRACHAVQEAVLAADSTVRTPQSLTAFRAWLAAGHDRNPSETWYLPGDVAGDVAGWYRIESPDLENQDRAKLDLNVHPAARRRGAGSALLRHAAERARVKATMLEWLAAAEPRLAMIDTGNAVTNRHMIAVNEALGYQLAEPGWQFFQLPLGAACRLVKNLSRVPSGCG